MTTKTIIKWVGKIGEAIAAAAAILTAVIKRR
jgi:hypothetical protein